MFGYDECPNHFAEGAAPLDRALRLRNLADVMEKCCKFADPVGL